MHQLCPGITIKHFVDKVGHRLSRYPFYDMYKVMIRNIQPRGIEIYLMLLSVVCHQYFTRMSVGDVPEGSSSLMFLM